MVSGSEEEIRSLMALSPGREAIKRSNESAIVGNGLMKEATQLLDRHNSLLDMRKIVQDVSFLMGKKMISPITRVSP